MDVRALMERNQDRMNALYAGKDQTARYEKLAADFRARFGTPLHPVGRITGSGKLEWLENGRPRALDWHGFTHY